jgi:hypothetical protein
VRFKDTGCDSKVYLSTLLAVVVMLLCADMKYDLALC